MSDSQFSSNGGEATDAENREKPFSVRQKRGNLSSIDELSVNMKDRDAVAYIETTDGDPHDPLNLEQYVHQLME